MGATLSAPMVDEELRLRIKARLEAVKSGAVEIFEVGPVNSDGRRKVLFYRHLGGESRQSWAWVRVGTNGRITECEEP